MTYEIYFPRGVATNAAFCNRVCERTRLTQNIKMGQHTLLISPRRYGKTSLVKYVIKENRFVFGETDLFVAIDAKRIQQQLLAGIKIIFRKSSSSLEQGIQLLRKHFKHVNSKWIIGTQGMQLSLIPTDENDPATNILEALLALESLLSAKKTRAVFFIDEVQEIGEVAQGKGIEGALRHCAQGSKYLSFVFSGSNRHLLSNMFFDNARPLYKLCDKITLDRISRSDYEDHLNILAQKRWQEPLPSDALKALFSLTKRHPYYLNILCLRLWESSLTHTPSQKEVETFWLNYVQEERKESAQKLSLLSTGQRKILIKIATGSTQGLTSKQNLNELNMSGSSVSEALQVLERKDYIEIVESQGYHVLDPLIKSSLNLYYADT